MNEEHKEIDLIEFLSRIIKKWWLVVVLIFIFMGLAYCVTKALITPLYKTTTIVIIGKEGNSIAGLSLSDLEVGNKLVNDYKELLKTNLVAEEVIKELTLKATPSELKKFLQVEIVKDSRIMHISYRDSNPEMAAKIVDKFSDVLKEKAEAIVGVKNVYIIDYAVIPLRPDSPNTMLNLSIAGALGFMTAILTILFGMILDKTVHKEEEIEKVIGLPVLGIVPRFKGDARL